MGPSVPGVGGTASDGYVKCPTAPACPPAASRGGSWCCVDHTDTELTGEVVVNFAWELAGKLTFSVFHELNDNKIETHAIFNSPVKIQVSPADISAQGSSVARFGGGGAGTCAECGLTAAIAGVVSNFALYVSDRFGNRLPGVLDSQTSASPISANLTNLATNKSDSSVSIVDNGDGVQFVTITPTVSGTYRFELKVLGRPVAGTPSVVQVFPTFVFAAASTPEEFPTVAKAGKQVDLKIMARDAYGNVQEGGAVQPFRAAFASSLNLVTSLSRVVGSLLARKSRPRAPCPVAS